MKGALFDTAKIPLNNSIDENVWHQMTLIVDKSSESNVQLFFDDKFVGRVPEFLPPRDVGGPMIVNNPKHEVNKALFKNFVIERCLRFNSIGECKYTIENSKCYQNIQMIPTIFKKIKFFAHF